MLIMPNLHITSSISLSLESALVNTLANWLRKATCGVIWDSIFSLNEVAIHLNVFSPIMRKWIVGNMYSGLVITV